MNRATHPRSRPRPLGVTAPVPRIVAALSLILLTSQLHAQSQACHRGFQTVEHAVTTSSIDSFSAGDFDEDGRADLAMKIFYDHNFLLINRGEEVFEPTSLGDVSDTNGGFVRDAFDVTGDGHLDLIVRSGGALVVRPGRGDGTFGEPVTTSIQATGEIRRVDVDGDGRLDWIEVSDTEIEFWIANADGTLRKAGSHAFDKAWVSDKGPFLFGDLDGDGRADAIRFGKDFRNDTPQAQILWNEGNFQFSTKDVGMPMTLRWKELEAFDIDGDGKVELIGTAGETLPIVYADGRTLTVSSIPLAQSATGFTPLLTADIDGDGRRDLVLKYYSATAILWGRPDGEPTYAVSMFDFPLAPVATADFNGDGISDLASISSEGMAFLYGSRDRQLRGAPLSLFSGTARVMIETDIDHDGHVDLVISTWDINLEVLRGEDGSRFSLRAAIPLKSAGGAADLDGDGNVDIVALSRSDFPKASVYFGSGWTFPVSVEVSPTATFGGIATLSNSTQALVMNDAGLITVVSLATRTPVATQIATGANERTFVVDIDGDGDSDVLALDNDGIGQLFTQSGGAWIASSVRLPFDRIEEIQAADLDGDSRVDLALRNELYYMIFIALGDGTYATRPTAQSFGSLHALRLSDVDHDGLRDVILSTRANSSDPSLILVHHNDGDGSTSGYGTLLFGPSLDGAIIVNDVDKDGWDDLIVGTPLGAAVLRNICASPRLRAAAVPSVAREGDPIRLVVHVLPTRSYLVGPIVVREGGAILHMAQPSLAFDFDTSTFTLPPLAVGRHDLTIEYRDQFAGPSTLDVTVHVVPRSIRRRAVR
jgi:hypothetical protein